MMIACLFHLKGVAFFPHKYMHSERFSIKKPSLWCQGEWMGVFGPSRDVKQSRGEALVSNKVPDSATGEYYHCLCDNSVLWIWGALKCRVISLNISALLCYLLEEKIEGGEGVNGVNEVGCSKVFSEWRSSIRALMKCVVFPLKYQNYGLHVRVLCALLDMNNFGTEYLLASAKQPVQGQCKALESHIAVCHPCCRDNGPKIPSWHISIGAPVAHEWGTHVPLEVISFKSYEHQIMNSHWSVLMFCLLFINWVTIRKDNYFRHHCHWFRSKYVEVWIFNAWCCKWISRNCWIGIRSISMEPLL